MNVAETERRKLAIAQAYSIIRWDEKLEHLPADMVDGCYDFASSVMNPQRDGIARQRGKVDQCIRPKTVLALLQWKCPVM